MGMGTVQKRRGMLTSFIHAFDEDTMDDGLPHFCALSEQVVKIAGHLDCMGNF